MHPTPNPLTPQPHPHPPQELPAEYVANQKAVDAALAGKLGELKAYLAATFSLRSSDRPHLMKF